MKLKKILIVAASALLLSACGGTAAGTLPKGGHPATAASTVEVIGRAYESLLDLDSVEANFNLKKIHFDGSFPTTVNEVPGHTIVKADASMKTKFAVVGLQSETLAGLKAEVKLDDLAFDLYAGTKFGEVEEAMVELDYSDIDAAAYLSNGGLYVNASDAELRGLISDFLTSFVATDATEEEIAAMMESIPNKFQMPGLISEEMLPIMGMLEVILDVETLPTTEEVVAMLGEVINEPTFAIVDDYVTILDYDDGSFGIGIDITKEDVLSLASIVISSMEEGIPQEQLDTILAEYAKVFEVDSFKVTVLLNKDALLSDFLVDIDVSIDTSLSELMSESGQALQVDAAIKSDLTLKYGDDVSVILPADLSTYQVMNTPN